MSVLVTAASKHGATREIASTIAAGLERRGVRATVRDPGQVTSLAPYDAVVLGSAVYAGHWLAPAKELAAARAGELATRPVWLFSSGPLGTPEPMPEGEPVDVAEIVAATGAREHRVFAGRLQREKLGFGERALVRALKAPYGDFRPWEEIDAFAGEIARELAPAGAR